MHQGLPVIATTAVGAAQGGLVQHGENGENGEVVAKRGAAALPEAIQRVMWATWSTANTWVAELARLFNSGTTHG